MMKEHVGWAVVNNQRELCLGGVVFVDRYHIYTTKAKAKSMASKPHKVVKVFIKEA